MGFGDIRKKKQADVFVPVKKKKILKKWNTPAFQSSISIPSGVMIENDVNEVGIEELGYEEDEEEVEDEEVEVKSVKKQDNDVIPNWIFLLIMASIYGIGAWVVLSSLGLI